MGCKVTRRSSENERSAKRETRGVVIVDGDGLGRCNEKRGQEAKTNERSQRRQLDQEKVERKKVTKTIRMEPDRIWCAS